MMNKSNLIELMSSKSEYLVKKDIEEGVNQILQFSSETLSQGNRIEIRGFGSFSTRLRNSRITRNPRTGTALRIGPISHPYFRASINLKKSLMV